MKTLAKFQIEALQSLLYGGTSIQEAWETLEGVDNDATWDDLTRIIFIDGSCIDIDVRDKLCEIGLVDGYVIEEENEEIIKSLMLPARVAKDLCLELVRW